MTIAFVAGASGYTGREVVKTLRRRGVRTIAHVRPDSPRGAEHREHFNALGAEVDDTPWEEDALVATLERLRPTHVFALLGITKRRAATEARATGRDISYDSVDYGLTAMLLRAARAVNARFVYLSAASIGSPGSYSDARRRAEHDIRESGLSYLIARPAFIGGSDRAESRPVERATARLLDGALAVAGALGAARFRRRYQSMTAAELARGLVELALAGDESRIVYGDDLHM